uniref:Mitochondrial import inner membrane translocase subunit Tim21 n=1 Tax=Megafenestra aurita TaxID=2291010 RepID=A0A4Y7NKA3_9CRUS|nr:EOG090X0I05 [Megafenestra aurita]
MMLFFRSVQFVSGFSTVLFFELTLQVTGSILHRNQMLDTTFRIGAYNNASTGVFRVLGDKVRKNPNSLMLVASDLNSRLETLTYAYPVPSFHRNIYVFHSLRQVRKREETQPQLAKSTSQSDVSVSLGAKVKDAGKTVWYSGIVICGFIATGAILFAVIKELFWSQSPQSIYSDALKKCTEFPKICDLLGEPITGFCDGSGRRGRTNLRYSQFLKDGVEHLRIRFYIKGIRNQATVHAEMEKRDGRFEYIYLLADTENYPKEQIFVIDNRKQELSYQEF